MTRVPLQGVGCADETARDARTSTILPDDAFAATEIWQNLQLRRGPYGANGPSSQRLKAGASRQAAGVAQQLEPAIRADVVPFVP
jgi:hypothetical protein